MVVTSSMSQGYKSVYFRDASEETGSNTGLTLAFGKKDAHLFRAVRAMSSEDIRQLLGYQRLSSIRKRAARANLPINTWCVRKLRQRMPTRIAEPGQLYLSAAYLDPVHSTFRGGEAEPLHTWYPLLEGYSPSFVRSVHKRFAPSARRILDPFAGTGTTPLTAARMGLDAFYCEVNPLLQFLIEVKVGVLAMGDRERGRLLNDLSAISSKIPGWLSEGPEDGRLARDYAAVFAESTFFDDDIFSEVLRARTLVDHVAWRNRAAANLLSIAVVASLIPASKLKRAGDVRYKRPDEMRTTQPSLTQRMCDRLARIIADVSSLEYVDRRPVLVCEDARYLGDVPELDCDCVITSPPYLNGTNYFRNTKVELWFLRCLSDKKDLSAFRRRAVTAGINDVTRDRFDFAEHPAVQGTVRRLQEAAYDLRIPKMAASYFRDMADIFGGLKRQLRAGASVAIDVGDSSYGAVHVPTDVILTDILSDLGFAKQDEIILRRRKSRDQTALRQVLLVFKFSAGTRTGPPADTVSAIPTWQPKWELFKQRLPHQSPPFSKRNWGHPLHSLCSYQGKMKPSIAHHLVSVFLNPGERVLDPFAGVGTIPFEAQLHGCESFGFEISPAALSIASAKCGYPVSQECYSILNSLDEYLCTHEPTESERRDAACIAFNGRLPDFFHDKTFREILLSRRYFLCQPPAAASEFLVHACLLHILHGNRPYALSRRSHNTTPFAPSGPFEYRPLIPRLRAKVTRSLRHPKPQGLARGTIFFQDATEWWPSQVTSLDAVITSPPFFDSTRFHLANWLRLWFCGWERHDFETRPKGFVDERQKKSFSVYEGIFRQAKERLKVGGILVFHLGKSRKCDMAKEIASVAGRWFKCMDVFSEDVRHCERHGVRDKGTVSEHQYVILR